MAQRSRFFDSVDGEPSYGSEAFAQWSKGILSEGYVPNVEDELEVTESSPAAMSVRVGLGIAWVDGRFFEVYDSAETLTIPAADGSNPRIDRVVVRNDLDARETVLAVKTGSPASDPDPPSLQRDSTIYEISLAQVLVGAGATSITDSNITDERDDEDVCGAAETHTKMGNVRGSYTGDGTSNRLISVGSSSINLVYVRAEDSTTIFIAIVQSGTETSHTHAATEPYHLSQADRVEIDEANEGFRVSAAANNNTFVYNWVAIT